MKLETTAAWWLRVRIHGIWRSRIAWAIDSSNNFSASWYSFCCSNLVLLVLASLNRLIWAVSYNRLIVYGNRHNPSGTRAKSKLPTKRGCRTLTVPRAG